MLFCDGISLWQQKGTVSYDGKKDCAVTVLGRYIVYSDPHKPQIVSLPLPWSQKFSHSWRHERVVVTAGTEATRISCYEARQEKVFTHSERDCFLKKDLPYHVVI